LDEVGEDMPFAGVDIGWRLVRSAWGHGYATEAALACLAFGFEVLGLPEVVASTTADNLRSQAVMRWIGMTRDPADDFEDPSVPEGPLRQCVLYRTRAEIPTVHTTRRDTARTLHERAAPTRR
jgi:RimJ/RimL family protein N-acetyltransferase